MLCRNKIFLIIFLFSLSFFFGSPIQSSEKIDSIDKYRLSDERFLTSKTRAADSLNCTLIGGLFSGPTYPICVNDSFAYISAGHRMKILNVKDSTNPILLGEIKLPDSAQSDVVDLSVSDIDVRDTLAFVAEGPDGLRIINVANPSLPFEVGFFETSYSAGKVWVQDTLAYILDCDLPGSGDALLIINIADPTSPAEIGSYDYPGYAYANDLWILDTLAYTAGDSVRIIDISDPTSPVQLGAYYDESLEWEIYSICVHDTLAYIGTKELSVINISDPTSPVIVGSYSDPNWRYDDFVWDITVQDSIAYLAVSSFYINGDSLLWIVNISDPTSISEVGHYYTPGRPSELFVTDNLAYVNFMYDEFKYLDGIVILDIHDPSSPSEIGRYEMGGFNEAVWVEDSLAYVANSSRGLRIINIENPSNCGEVGFFDPPGWSSEVGVFLKDTLVYVLDNDSGFRVIDVSDPVLPVGKGFYNTANLLYDIWVKDTLAYLANSDSGLRIINVSNSSSMNEIGYCYIPGCAFDLWVQDTFVYVASDSGLRIIDVSNNSSPFERGFLYDTLGEDDLCDIFVQDTLAYLLDGSSGLRIINISDPGSVSEVGSYSLPGANTIWVKDNLAYVTCYDSVCLRVLDVSTPSSPNEVGFYQYPYREAYGLYVKDSLIYTCQLEYGLYIFNYTGIIVGIEEISEEKEEINVTSISNTIEINYSIVNTEEKVKIEIFNVLGQKVGCPVDEVKPRGNYTVNWNGKTGIYFVRIEMGGEIYRQKTLLVY